MPSPVLLKIGMPTWQLILFHHPCDVEVTELAVSRFTGGLGHEVLAFLGFGEGDDVADAVFFGENTDEAVEAEGDASVGRGTVFEGFEHVAKAGFHHIFGDF